MAKDSKATKETKETKATKSTATPPADYKGPEKSGVPVTETVDDSVDGVTESLQNSSLARENIGQNEKQVQLRENPAENLGQNVKFIEDAGPGSLPINDHIQDGSTPGDIDSKPEKGWSTSAENVQGEEVPPGRAVIDTTTGALGTGPKPAKGWSLADNAPPGRAVTADGEAQTRDAGGKPPVGWSATGSKEAVLPGRAVVSNTPTND